MTTEAAEESWERRNSRVATPRRAYMQGYADGAFTERLRITAFLAENIEAITKYAGDQAPELLKFMFSEMPGSVDV